MTRRARSSSARTQRSRRSASLAALVLGRPEIVALTAPFLLALGAGLALARVPRFTAEIDRRRRAVEGDEFACGSRSPRLPRSIGSTSSCGCPKASKSSHGDRARSLRLARGERREVELTLRADRWGAHRLGPVYLRAHDPFGLFVAEGCSRARREIRVYPARRRSAADPAAARDASLHRQRGRAPQGRGNRVRRHAAMVARRPSEARQLASDRAARRDLGEREPS